VKGFISFFSILLCGVLVHPAGSRADIYKYVDENGVIHFTNTPTDKRFRMFMKTSAGVPHREQRYDTIIARLCRKYAVDTALVKAVIKTESDFNPYAVSKKGAQGLMQLMPHKARELNVSDPFDPRENLQAGISHLGTLLNRFDGDVKLALAAYNAGENAVHKNNGVPPFFETQEYIKRVLKFKQHYE